MGIQQLDDGALSPALRARVARYRHEVFVQSLKWDLLCAEGFEQDEFDRPGAVHLVSTEADHTVSGYARLLPTTGSYLLAEHFAQLLNGRAAPCTPEVWELSRFTSAAGLHAQADPAAQTRVGKQLLLAAVRYALSQGARDLVFCTTVAIERLAKRWGVEIERLGPPQRSSAGLLVAAQIRCSARTVSALSAPEGIEAVAACAIAETNSRAQAVFGPLLAKVLRKEPQAEPASGPLVHGPIGAALAQGGMAC
jgi:acyl homoserine lactone synthase